MHTVPDTFGLGLSPTNALKINGTSERFYCSAACQEISWYFTGDELVDHRQQSIKTRESSPAVTRCNLRWKSKT